jgi:imidazolonepropionase-like amidohydrolase
MHISVKKLTVGLLLAGPTVGAQSSPLVITGLTLIDMVDPRPRPMMSLLVERGRITRMGPTKDFRAPAGARVLDLTGRYAIPGLIDAHVHLTAPFERRGQQDSLSIFFFRGGITAIRDMAGDARVLRERARAASTDSVESPRIFYSTLVAGPNFFRTDRRAASLARDTIPGTVAWQRSIVTDADAVVAARGADSIGATALKAYAELTPSQLAALTRAAHERGLKMWSHAAVIPAKPSDAVAAGVDVLSHAFMLMLEDVDSVATTYVGGLDQHIVAKHPVTAPVYERLVAEMARRGTMLDPTLYAINRFATSRAVLEGELTFMQGIGEWGIAISKLAHNAGVRFVAGTDVSGYPGQNPMPTLHDELEIFVDRVGMTPAEALATATRNAAEALGASSDMGTIAVGKFADLVILEANPLDDIRNTRRIVAVIRAGRVFRR